MEFIKGSYAICVVLKTVDSFLRYPQGDKIPVFCYLL